MTTARPPGAGSTAPLPRRLALACALAAAGGVASAASIDELPVSGYDPLATGNAFDVQRLDDDAASDLLPEQDSSKVEQVLRSLRMPRPQLVDEEHWFDDSTTQPLALQPETLLRGVDDDIWLSEQGTTRRVENGPGLRDVLRSIVNVGFDDASMEPDMEPDAAAQAIVPTRRGNRDAGSDLLRDFVTSTIEPYRRADGTVGFSVLGMGDFYAEADGGLRSIQLIEENTGWSFAIDGPAQPPPPREHVSVDTPREAVIVPAGATPVDASEMRIGEKVRAIGRWVRDSLMVRLFIAAWILIIVGRSLLHLGRSLKSTRRARASLVAPQPEAAAMGRFAPPPAQDHAMHRRSRRHRRRRGGRSPTLRNLLRSLGLR